MSSRRVERALRAGGYSTAHAQSGLDGVENARRSPPDLVLITAPLTDLEPNAITLSLRALPGWEHRAIVVVDDTVDVQEAIAVGANGSLRQDASLVELIRKVRGYLRGECEAADESSEIRLREVTHRMAADMEAGVRALKAANRDLEHLARVRSELLRNVSHELATPITPAIGYVELLKSGAVGPMSPQQRHILDALSTSLDRLQHVVGVLREVGAFENNEITPKFTNFSLKRFAQTFEDTWNVERARVEVTLIGPRCDVVGDSKLLGRALGRIVENAFKFGDPDVRVHVKLEIDEGFVSISTRDDGPGIPAAQIERLGDLFHQGDGSPTRRHGGVGLGLAYGRRVMLAHGGALTVMSPPRVSMDLRVGRGRGTEVVLRWPLCGP